VSDEDDLIEKINPPQGVNWPADDDLMDLRRYKLFRDEWFIMQQAARTNRKRFKFNRIY